MNIRIENNSGMDGGVKLLIPGKDVGGCNVKNLPPEKIILQRLFEKWGDFRRMLLMKNNVEDYQPRM